MSESSIDSEPTSSSTPADGSSDPQSDGRPVDQKAAFKAALDKKKAAAGIRSQHLDGESQLHGTSHAAATKRQFRRKSG